MRKWLAEPSARCPSALWFRTDMKVMTAMKRRRIRAATKGGAARAGRAALSVEGGARGTSQKAATLPERPAAR